MTFNIHINIPWSVVKLHSSALTAAAAAVIRAFTSLNSLSITALRTFICPNMFLPTVSSLTIIFEPTINDSNRESSTFESTCCTSSISVCPVVVNCAIISKFIRRSSRIPTSILRILSSFGCCRCRCLPLTSTSRLPTSAVAALLLKSDIRFSRSRTTARPSRYSRLSAAAVGLNRGSP